MTFADRMPAGPAFALCFLAFQLLALLMGYGAALLVLPRSARRDALVLAPVIGLCVLGTAGWHLMFLGPDGTDRQWPWMVALGAVLTAAGVLLRRRELRATLDRDALLLAACAAAGVLLYAHGTLREPRLTAAAQNNDISHYATIERQLRDLPGDAAPGPADQFGLVQFARTSVPGAFLPTAFLSSALRVRTYQLQTVCIASYLFWGALLAGVLARRALGFQRGGAMLVSLLAGVSQVTLYAAWCAFKASLAGTALMLALLLVVLPALGSPPPPERPLARVPAVALLGFGLSLTYPHMLPIVWAVLGALALAHAAAGRSLAPLKAGAALLGAGLLGVAALSPGHVWTTGSYLFQMKETTAGWPMPPISLPALLGLSGRGPSWAVPLGAPGQVAAGIAAAALLLRGLRRTFTEDRGAATTAAALLATLGLGYLVMWLTPAPSDLEGYKPFKLVSYFYPVVLACLLLAFRPLAMAAAGWRGRLEMGGAAGIAAGAVLLSAATASWTRAALSAPHADLVDLQRVEADPAIESINIISPVWWDAMWQTAFLLKKPLFLKHLTYYDPSARLEGTWDLDRVDEVLEPGDPAAAIRVNATYVLRRRESRVSAEYGEGWSDPEPGHRWTVARRATLRVEAGAPRPVTLELRYSHLTPGTTFTVLLDGQAVGSCPGPESCSVGPFDLAAGSHVLSFECSNPPRSPGPSDPRLLETAFTRIRFSSGSVR